MEMDVDTDRLAYIQDLNDKHFVVIDLDTGTVLGKELVLVYLDDEDEEKVLSSDSAATEYGMFRGISLMAYL